MDRVSIDRLRIRQSGTVNKQKAIARQKQRRRYRVRKRVPGTAERPRMCIYRSHKHMACQLIDDVSGRTLVSASTRDKQLRDSVNYGGNCDAARQVGQEVARRAMEAGIQAVKFDRGACKYQGRVAALADAAREAGLKF